MEIVIDSNCLISALIKPARSREIICSFKFILYAPEHLISETLKNKKEIINKSKINEFQFDEFINVLLSNINIVPENEFEYFKERALKLVKHPEDMPFIALCLLKNIPLWSDDKALKQQSVVKVYSTYEIIDLFKDD